MRLRPGQKTQTNIKKHVCKIKLDLVLLLGCVETGYIGVSILPTGCILRILMLDFMDKNNTVIN